MNYKLKVIQSEFQQKIDSLKEEMKKNNPVPIGFTYVQLPHEKQPGDIWPGMIWEDVSAKYSGVFFRVVGGEAGAFGEIQMENTNRITKFNGVREIDVEWRQTVKNEAHRNTIIGSNGSSKWIYTGEQGNAAPAILINFESSGGENRPKNMAVKVWRRTR